MQPAEPIVYAVQSDFVSHLVMIPGIVTAASKPRVSSQACATPPCLLASDQPALFCVSPSWQSSPGKEAGLHNFSIGCNHYIPALMVMLATPSSPCF